MLYTKLAFRNVRRSAKDYLIYMVTMTLCTTMFYAFLSICSTHYNPDLGTQFNFNMLSQGMKLAMGLCIFGYGCPVFDSSAGMAYRT